MCASKLAPVGFFVSQDWETLKLNGHILEENSRPFPQVDDSQGDTSRIHPGKQNVDSPSIIGKKLLVRVRQWQPTPSPPPPSLSYCYTHERFFPIVRLFCRVRSLPTMPRWGGSANLRSANLANLFLGCRPGDAVFPSRELANCEFGEFIPPAADHFTGPSKMVRLERRHGGQLGQVLRWCPRPPVTSPHISTAAQALLRRFSAGRGAYAVPLGSAVGSRRLEHTGRYGGGKIQAGREINRAC